MLGVVWSIVETVLILLITTKRGIAVGTGVGACVAAVFVMGIVAVRLWKGEGGLNIRRQNADLESGVQREGSAGPHETLQSLNERVAELEGDSPAVRDAEEGRGLRTVNLVGARLGHDAAAQRDADEVGEGLTDTAERLRTDRSAEDGLKSASNLPPTALHGDRRSETKNPRPAKSPFPRMKSFTAAVTQQAGKFAEIRAEFENRDFDQEEEDERRFHEIMETREPSLTMSICSSFGPDGVPITFRPSRRDAVSPEPEFDGGYPLMVVDEDGNEEGFMGYPPEWFRTLTFLEEVQKKGAAGDYNERSRYGPPRPALLKDDQGLMDCRQRTEQPTSNSLSHSWNHSALQAQLADKLSHHSDIGPPAQPQRPSEQAFSRSMYRPQDLALKEKIVDKKQQNLGPSTCKAPSKLGMKLSRTPPNHHRPSLELSSDSLISLNTTKIPDPNTPTTFIRSSDSSDLDMIPFSEPSWSKRSFGSYPKSRPEA